jgi:eukaryotic-like serine/threonine-protein kinase
MADLTGQSLGRYHILELLGEGGMAFVYKAYDTRLERNVALKVIRTDLFGQVQIEQMLQRFDREAKSLAKLAHPNIVNILDYGEHEGSPFLVMEYLPGGTLKQKMGRPFPWQEAVRILIPLASGLAYAHQHGIIHRDVKPANILINDTGNPVLTDFGLAKLLETVEGLTLTGSGVGIGTPEYMAPEQGMGEKIDARVDVYALGVVMFELIAGRRPYVADTPMAVVLKHISDPLPAPRDFAPELPESVEYILYKALAKHPDDRYQTMEAFKEDLENLQTGLTTQHTMPNVEAPTVIGQKPKMATQAASKRLAAASTKESKVAKPLRWLWVAIPVVCLLLVGALVVFTSNGVIPALFAQATATQAIVAPPTSTLPPILVPTETVTLISSPTPFPAEISDKNGVSMRFVPAGEFTMGDTSAQALAECQKYRTDCKQAWFTDEEPPTNVYLDAFYIDTYEVSNLLYRECVDVGACQPPIKISSYTHPSYYGNSEFSNYPVIYVDWNMANAYCAWRGARLPTEAEWEKAARGADGNVYPWGNNFNGINANYCDKNCSQSYANKNYDDGYNDVAPIDAYPKGVSVYGVYNLAGNVWEWVSSLYQPYPYSATDGRENLNALGDRVQRGGSWFSYDNNLRSVARSSDKPANATVHVGFRCARNP